MSNLRLLWKNRVALKIFTVLNMHFLSFRNFEQLIYIFYHSGFLSNVALALKNRVAQFIVLKTLLTFRSFEQLSLALKNRGCLNSQYWIYIFYHSGFLNNLRLPWKTELPWNFSLYWRCIFYHSGFLSNLRLPWKTELPWKFSLYGIYFLYSEFLNNLRLPGKNRVALEYLTVLNMYFYHPGFLSNLRLLWKNRVALKFLKPGVAAVLPDPPPRTPMNMSHYKENHVTWFQHCFFRIHILMSLFICIQCCWRCRFWISYKDLHCNSKCLLWVKNIFWKRLPSLSLSCSQQVLFLCGIKKVLVFIFGFS